MSKESEKYPVQREAFEKWVVKELGYSMERDDNGDYKAYNLDIYWIGWQAAQHQDRELISELVTQICTTIAAACEIPEEDLSAKGKFSNLYHHITKLNPLVQKAQKRLKEV